MLLKSDLKDSDIPHRTTIRNCIKEVWDKYLIGLEADIKEALGKVSFTTDLWTDPNLSPFMAVTAHWIETKLMDTPDGPQYKLTLRAELVGFHRVPGHHDGEHLAQAFLFVLDRISITSKIGWVTVDNASNNDTFMTALERELRSRDIPFNRVENRIRCFPHIVNLACKAILAALSEYDYIEHQALSGGATGTEHASDPVSTLRAVIRAIRASSLRRQQFAAICATYKVELQLLRDVNVRWSSTLYMIDRAIHLEKPLDAICSSTEFPDLAKYKLTQEEWDALAIVREILLVPDAFQQKLSAEKTPTLCGALPSFDGMVDMLNEKKILFGYPFSHIIDEGIKKLDAYHDRVALVPAYTISMLLNPGMKLEKIPDYKQREAKDLFRSMLVPYYEKRTASMPTQAQGSSSVGTPRDPPAGSTLPEVSRPMDYTPCRSRVLRGELIRQTIAHRTADEILGLSRRSAPRNTSLDDEITRYLNDSSTGTSSISYWQENQLRYPTLFLAALDYLAIQGSSVPCERVFSSAKETMTDRRNRVLEDLMEMLQMLKFTMKGGKSLNFTSGTSREEIEEYLETLADEETAVPEDIRGYIQSLLIAAQ